jgi:[CysO sulfur-carrier protein]-S-L-cysteine hydrolase
MKTMRYTLAITPAIYVALQAHAVAEYPHECCGLLLGPPAANGVATLGEYFALENELHSPTRYRSSPASMFAAIRHQRATGQTILAIFHSHPTSPPIPSNEDREQNYAADIPNLILGKVHTEWKLRAWWLGEAEAECEIVLLEEA